MTMCEVILHKQGENYWVWFKPNEMNVKGIIIDILDSDVEMLKKLSSDWIYENVNKYVRDKMNELGIEKL
jgi:hypothetical protein